jgi:two-component system cell cycle response regulator
MKDRARHTSVRLRARGEELSSDPRRYLHRQLTMPVLMCISVLLWLGTLSGTQTRPWASTAVVGLAAALCLWRGFMLQHERAGWLLMSAALTSFTAGQVYLDLGAPAAGPPFPSLADVGHLGFYPFACAALWQLARGRTSTPGNRRFDGLTTALTVTALAAAVVVEPLLNMPHRSPLAVVVAIAYPLVDLALLGLLVALVAIAGWPAGRSSRFMILGLASFGVSDIPFLLAQAAGVHISARWTDAGWPIACVLLAVASWVRGGESRPRPRRVTGHQLFPSALCAAAAVVMLLDGMLEGINPLELGLIATTLVCGAIRIWQAFEEAQALNRQVRTESLTDSLTGLPNRRQLLLDLDGELASIGSSAVKRSVAFVIYDLNGFKSYNDTFGHLAGDDLLRRLARSLAASVDGSASAYRLGGDEFCMLLPSDANLGYLITRATAALSEAGEDYDITAAHGMAILPDDVSTVSDAMRIADLRMYAQKAGGRTSVGAQMRDVLLCTLSERSKALGYHNNDVARMARDVAHKLRVSNEQVDEVVRAAELHDVGKVAVPDSILFKPGPLSDEEWDTMRLHTIIGQRILAASPALAPVGRLVRSSHERWDGAGYPDKLAGEEIPLGARIVSVCDAFDAMITDRAYREAMPHADALTELQRCSGTQFDPTVVTAFLALVAEQRPQITWTARQPNEADA